MITQEPATTVGEVVNVLRGLIPDTPIEPVRIELDWEGERAELRFVRDPDERSQAVAEAKAAADKWRITSDAHCSVLMRAEDVLLGRFDGLTVADQAEELQRLLVEFDAWLGFRGEFSEVLTAFRSAFGTDTSAAAIAASEDQHHTKTDERSSKEGETHA